jgi:hypothetical protein
VNRSVAARRRDTAFACCLAIVLGFGVLGVLLLNTSMQQQARRLALQHQRVTELQAQAQVMSLDLDLAADPSVLAAEARRLHLRPTLVVKYVRTNGVSARKRGAGRDRAG